MDILYTAGILLVYFGYQSSMNLAAKNVLNKVSAPFFVTGMQQVIALGLFLAIIAGSRLISRPYEPRALSGWKDYGAVCIFSFSFCMNIGLNNFSLSLIPMSLNLVLRSCLPLATYLTSVVLGHFLGTAGKRNTAGEVTFMCVGVACAILTVFASITPDKNGVPGASSNSRGLMIGIIAAVGSLGSAALNMVLASLLGSNLKMNPLDTTGYMAFPAGLMLVVPILCFPHPLTNTMLESYTAGDQVTDTWVVAEVVKTNPKLLMLVLCFGPVAFLYNILQWKLVQSMSATTTTFAGNFNKAASIVIAVLIGIDTLPSGHFPGRFSPEELGAYAPTRAFVYKAAVAGNILAFTAYSLLQEYNKKHEEAEQLQASKNPSFAEAASFLDPHEHSMCRDERLGS
jgi:hypothetical protein